MSTISPPQGVEIPAEVSPEGAEILTPEALALVAQLHRTFEPRRRELLAARVVRAARAGRGRHARLPSRDGPHPRGQDLAGGPGSGRPAGPPRGDHRPGRPQDDHQRAQLRREGVHVRLRGLEHAHLGEPDPGPDQPARRRRRDDLLQQPGRQGVRAQRHHRDAAGAPARLAPVGEARAGRRRAGLGGHLRPRALHVPQRHDPARPRARGRTSTCRSSRATSRRASGTTSS